MHPVLIHIGALQIPSYGALAAVGVLAALLLAQRTAVAVGISPSHIWNVSVIALFAALLGSRLLLLLLNWRDVMRHPLWMLGLATIQHPLLALAGVACAAAAGLLYIRRQRVPLLPALDALAGPVTLALVFEQAGALLAGSGYGTDTTVRWAVTYTSVLAARWSGTPLGVPLHPVQAYAALGYMTLALLLLVWMPARRQQGDIAGMAAIGIGIVVFITELWRDTEGRGPVLRGALDGPQVAAIVLVLGGALLLRERPAAARRAEVSHG